MWTIFSRTILSRVMLSWANLLGLFCYRIFWPFFLLMLWPSASTEKNNLYNTYHRQPGLNLIKLKTAIWKSNRRRVKIEIFYYKRPNLTNSYTLNQFFTVETYVLNIILLFSVSSNLYTRPECSYIYLLIYFVSLVFYIFFQVCFANFQEC